MSWQENIRVLGRDRSPPCVLKAWVVATCTWRERPDGQAGTPAIEPSFEVTGPWIIRASRDPSTSRASRDRPSQISHPMYPMSVCASCPRRRIPTCSHRTCEIHEDLRAAIHRGMDAAGGLEGNGRRGIASMIGDEVCRRPARGLEGNVRLRYWRRVSAVGYWVPNWRECKDSDPQICFF